MILRRYCSADCLLMAELFYQTVHHVNVRDYSREQVDVWATGEVDLVQWDRLFSEHYTIVAVEDGVIIGFGDVDSSGYLDKLYIHKDYQRRGIASVICDALEQHAGNCTITTHASITARPFFEQRGYRTVKEQQVIRRGVALKNYVMEKQPDSGHAKSGLH